MKAMGVSDAEIERARAMAAGVRREKRVVVIDKDNVASVRVFLRLRSQWRTRELTGKKFTAILHTALRYDAAESVARALKLDWDEDLLDALRVLEGEAKRLLGLQTLADLRRA